MSLDKIWLHKVLIIWVDGPIGGFLFLVAYLSLQFSNFQIERDTQMSNVPFPRRIVRFRLFSQKLVEVFALLKIEFHFVVFWSRRSTFWDSRLLQCLRTKSRFFFSINWSLPFFFYFPTICPSYIIFHSKICQLVFVCCVSVWFSRMWCTMNKKYTFYS